MYWSIVCAVGYILGTKASCTYRLHTRQNLWGPMTTCVVPTTLFTLSNYFSCLYRPVFANNLGVYLGVNHDNYIRRPEERGKQVGKEGVSTRKSYCPIGVLPLELIKSGTHLWYGSYPSVSLPYNTGLLAWLALTRARTLIIWGAAASLAHIGI